MSKPYSMDLRERVVAAVETGGMSRRQAAAHFGVSYSAAIAWVESKGLPVSVQVREDVGPEVGAAVEELGMVADSWRTPVMVLDPIPSGSGGYKPRTISGTHHDWLVQRCRTANFTLRGLVSELAKRGVKVDYRSVWEFVHAEGLSHKKRR